MKRIIALLVAAIWDAGDACVDEAYAVNQSGGVINY